MIIISGILLQQSPFTSLCLRGICNHDQFWAMSSDKETSFLFLTISENSFLSFSPFPICRMKSCSSSCLTDHLLAAFFSRHFSTKSQQAGENFILLSLWGSLVEMKYMAFRGGILRKGGSPYASSTAMTPTDQTSTSSLQGSFLINSGAIQAGVPTTLFLFFCSLVNWMAKPKSATFIVPSLATRILSDLRSRWICLCSCSIFSPNSISLMIKAATLSGIFFIFWQMISVSAPPSIYSMSMKRQFMQQQDAWQLTMFLLAHIDITAASILILCRISCSGTFMTRTAQHQSGSFLLKAWQTVHMAPLPNCLAKRYNSLGLSGRKVILLICSLNSESVKRALSGISSFFSRPVMIWIITCGLSLMTSLLMSFLLNNFIMSGVSPLIPLGEERSTSRCILCWKFSGLRQGGWYLPMKTGWELMRSRMVCGRS